ncbi:MAG: flagellar hook capping FlgD N-terminal domain-containing protein [bacterium]
MSVNSVNNVVPVEKAINQNTSSSKGVSSLGSQEYLNLMVSQLQYQDPLEPMENTAFIAEMAQFSALEQMNNLNSSFSAMFNLLQTTQASAIIGKTVTAINPETGEQVQGVVDSVVFEQGIPMLVVGDEMVDLDNLVQIG